MWKRALAAILAGTLTMLVTRVWRDYPWLLAAISGGSLGALVFACLQTLVRLRATLAQYGPRPGSPEPAGVDQDVAGADSADSPGADPERDQQQ